MAADAQTSATASRTSDEVFSTYTADPRALSTYMSIVNWEAPSVNTTVAKVGVGDGITFARGRPRGVELGAGLDFVVHAQFDADARSFDFLNTDFIVGIPVSFRAGLWSGEVRFGHWSAHLGDEFLLRSGVDRQETSVEFVKFLGARDLGPARLVVGGEHRFRTVPGTMPPNLLYLGGEVRPDRSVSLGSVGDARLTLGTDLRWDEATGGTPALALQAGIEITPRGAGPDPRVWAIQFELFDGPSPFGQYFLEPLRTIGVGFRLR